MDAKITKKRLGLLLSYDWLKIIALIVAFIVLWSLIFTTSATRITPAQQFTIFNYSGTSTTTRFSDLSNTLEKNKVFSYDILDVVMTDVTAGDSQAETLIQTRLTTDEGDALFASNTVQNPNAIYTDDQGNTFSPTYLEQFVTCYYYYIKPVNEYVEDMEAFLNEYYTDFRAENAQIDSEKVEEVFRARVKKQKDKRYKKEADIQKGIKQETERIEKYRASLLKYEENLEAGYIVPQETSVYIADSKGNVVKETGYYSINLCPDKRMEDLRELVYYVASETVTDENGETHTYDVATAKDINLVLLDTTGTKYTYSLYESLSLVNYLVERYCDPTALEPAA